MRRVSVAWLLATGTLVLGFAPINLESELDRLEREIQAE
jgi:hypothetical protein